MFDFGEIKLDSWGLVRARLFAGVKEKKYRLNYSLVFSAEHPFEISFTTF